MTDETRPFDVPQLVTRTEYGRRHDRKACGCDTDDDEIYGWGPRFTEPPPLVSKMNGHLWARVQRTITYGEWETV